MAFYAKDRLTNTGGGGGGGGGSFAITSTSGTKSHGSSVTISGAQFGTKSAAAPVKYDDFQTGASFVANGWTVEGAHTPAFSTAELRSGTPFTRNGECYFERGISGGAGGDTSNFHLTGLTQTTYYLDFWTRVNASGGPPWPQNLKFIRLHQAGAGASNAYLGWNAADATGTVQDHWILIGEDLNPSGSHGDVEGTNTTIGYDMVYNTWVHFQMLVKIGTPGGSNGTLIVYVNGSQESPADNPRTPDWYTGTFPWLVNTETNFPEAYFGNYVRSDDHVDVKQYWESVYFDNSFCRVEIGDNASYESCTHREVWVPSAWANGSITATVNRGSFASNASVYLFVVDANNNATAGYPITLGT